MLSVKTDYLFILHWFLLPQKPYVLYWQGDCYVLVADVVPAGIAPQDFHLGDGDLRRSREMTILCSPKVTQHHIGAVAVLPPGKRTRPGHLGRRRRRTG